MKIKIQTLYGEQLTLIKCIICKHYVKRSMSNLLFMDGINEIRVCSKCDTY